MKRYGWLVAVLLAAMLVPACGNVLAVQWERGVSVGTTFIVPAGDRLEIAPGTNISFGAQNETRPSLTVKCALEANGTADNPVCFFARDDVFDRYRFPACISLENGLADNFTFKNTTFANIVVDINGSAGQFIDCIFDDCDVYAQNSPAVFLNCTFLTGAALLIRGSDPSLVTNVTGCHINGSTGGHLADWRWDTYQCGVSVNGYASIEGGDISDDGYGVRLTSGSLRMNGTTVQYCYYGITIGPGTAIPVLTNITVRECLYAGIRSYGNVTMVDCAVRNNGLGVLLYQSSGSSYAWTLSRCTVTGNNDFGIAYFGREPDASDTVFSDGAVQNARGRQVRFDIVNFTVTDPGGGAVWDFQLNTTDARGYNTSEARHDNTGTIYLYDRSVDNSGKEIFHYPYTITADKMGVANSTTVNGATGALKFVLPVLPDLFPLALLRDPPIPKEGQALSTSVRVQNRGTRTSPVANATLFIDGKRQSGVSVPQIAPGMSAIVQLDDWTARGGRHTFTICIDLAGSVAENNETNNNLTTTVAVAAAPAPNVYSPVVCLGAFALAGVLVLVIYWRFSGHRSEPPDRTIADDDIEISQESGVLRGDDAPGLPARPKKPAKPF